MFNWVFHLILLVYHLFDPPPPWQYSPPSVPFFGSAKSQTVIFYARNINMQSLTLPQLQSNHNHLLQHSPTYSSSNVIVSSNHYLPKLTASSSSSSTSFSPSKPPTSSATSSVESVQINGNGKYKLQVAVEGGCDHFAQIVNADLVEQKWKDKFSLLCRWSLKLQQRSTGHYTDGSKRRKVS